MLTNFKINVGIVFDDISAINPCGTNEFTFNEYFSHDTASYQHFKGSIQLDQQNENKVFSDFPARRLKMSSIESYFILYHQSHVIQFPCARKNILSIKMNMSAKSNFFILRNFSASKHFLSGN